MQDNATPPMTCLTQRLRLCRLLQGEDFAYLRKQQARLDERGNLLERFRRGSWRVGLLLDSAGCAYSVLGCHVLQRRMADGNEDATRFDQRPGTFLRLAANGIDDDIHIMSHLLKRCRVVIDHGLGAKRMNKLQVIAGCGSDHVRALPACKLHDVVAHTTRRAMDEHRLPGLQIGQGEQGDPGRARAERYRGSLIKADSTRFVCQWRVGGDHGIVGIRSVCS
jgi:hypothetical protein